MFIGPKGSSTQFLAARLLSLKRSKTNNRTINFAKDSKSKGSQTRRRPARNQSEITAWVTKRVFASKDFSNLSAETNYYCFLALCLIEIASQYKRTTNDLLALKVIHFCNHRLTTCSERPKKAKRIQQTNTKCMPNTKSFLLALSCLLQFWVQNWSFSNNQRFQFLSLSCLPFLLQSSICKQNLPSVNRESN